MLAPQSYLATRLKIIINLNCFTVVSFTHTWDIENVSGEGADENILTKELRNNRKIEKNSILRTFMTCFLCITVLV